MIQNIVRGNSLLAWERTGCMFLICCIVSVAFELSPGSSSKVHLFDCISVLFILRSILALWFTWDLVSHAWNISSGSANERHNSSVMCWTSEHRFIHTVEASKPLITDFNRDEEKNNNFEAYYHSHLQIKTSSTTVFCTWYHSFTMFFWPQFSFHYKNFQNKTTRMVVHGNTIVFWNLPRYYNSCTIVFTLFSRIPLHCNGRSPKINPWYYQVHVQNTMLVPW